MPISSTVVTVSSAATFLSSGGSGGGELRTVIVRNDSGVDLYIGGADVSTASGFRIPTASTQQIDLDVGDALYGIVAGASVPVMVLKTRT